MTERCYRCGKHNVVDPIVRVDPRPWAREPVIVCQVCVEGFDADRAAEALLPPPPGGLGGKVILVAGTGGSVETTPVFTPGKGGSP